MDMEGNMEETRWWTWLLLVSAIIAVILLVVAPLGYKYNLAPLQPSLMSLAVSLFAAVLIFVAGLVLVFVTHKYGLTTNRNLILVAMGISLIPMIVMGPQIQKARSVPPIHDITTDPSNPPQFDEIAKIRQYAPNDLVYGGDRFSPEELAEMQREAYPNVKSLRTDLSVAAAIQRAQVVLESQGLDIVNVSQTDGIVEATDTTFWFGFKDDLVVRVRSEDSGSVVDVRSVSRVGQSDIGVNAARIENFLEGFRDVGP